VGAFPPRWRLGAQVGFLFSNFYLLIKPNICELAFDGKHSSKEGARSPRGRKEESTR
jgi:hypothetical protein